MENIKCLMKDFSFLSFHHISRTYNGVADILSKKELGPMDGIIFYRVLHKGKLCRSGSLVLFFFLNMNGEGLELFCYLRGCLPTLLGFFMMVNHFLMMVLYGWGFWIIVICY